MIRSLTVAAALVLATASSSVLAEESPRRSREPGVLSTANKVLALVIDPAGPPAKPSESLHYLVTRESKEQGVIYAFSSPAAREQFVAERIEAGSAGQPDFVAETLTTCPNAWFKNTPGCTDSGSLIMACGQTNSYLSDSWNDRISCVQASGSWTILYKCYNFNRYPYNPNGTCSTLAMQGGTLYTDLNVYGFNNITSSIKVCPEGITFTECQNFF
jgi:hypothetical protein